MKPRDCYLECNCYVCRHSSEQLYCDPHVIRLSDWQHMDGRNGDEVSSNWMNWIQVCPYCGYVSQEISDETEATENWIAEQWRIASAIGDETAQALFVHYRINFLMDLDREKAYLSLRRAVWACDDATDMKGAEFCRSELLLFLDWYISDYMMYACQYTYGQIEKLKIMRIETTRRLGKFDQAAKECRQLRVWEKRSRLMKRYEKKLIAQQNSGTVYETDMLYFRLKDIFVDWLEMIKLKTELAELKDTGSKMAMDRYYREQIIPVGKWNGPAGYGWGDVRYGLEYAQARLANNENRQRNDCSSTSNGWDNG